MGSILEGFGGPKSSQNRSKIGLKSDHEANAKILRIIGRGGVFEDAGGRKSIKNRLKNDLMLRCQNNNPKMSEKWSNMAPNLVQVGVMLGSKIVLDVSKGEKNASQRPLEKRTRKSIKKARSGRPPGGKYDGGLRVIEPLLGPGGGTYRGETIF